MLKRVFIGGIFAVIFVASLIFFILHRTDSFENARATDAVPANAVLFAENLDYTFLSSEFITSNKVWADLMAMEAFKSLDSVFRAFDTKLSSMLILNELFEDKELSFSIHLIGKNKLSPLFYLSLGEEMHSQDVDNELEQAFQDAIINERKYEAVSLKDISFAEPNVLQNLTYAIKDGLFIASSASILVEDAIRNLNSDGGISNDRGFKLVASTAGKYVHGNLYINFQNIDHLLIPFVKGDQLGVLKSIGKLAQWGELDADINEDVVVLNGMTYVSDSVQALLNLFRDQSPVKLESPSYIPSNAVWFASAGVSDTESFGEQIHAYLQKEGQLRDFRAKDDRLKEALGSSPLNDLLDIMKDELVWFSVETGNAKKFSDVTIIEVKSRSETIERLSQWLTVYALNNSKSIDDYTDKFVLDEQTSYIIYELPLDLYKEFFIGKFFGKCFAIYDNYLIFSDSKEAITRTIYQNVLHKTIENDIPYSDVGNYISTRSNLTIYIRPGHFLEQQHDLLNSSKLKVLADLQDVLSKFPGLVIQFSNEGDVFYSNISLKYTGNVTEKAMTVWESLLDSTAIIKPALVINHNTSEKEILVQDATNAVYLVNGTGRVLWKVKLEGPLRSEIFQVDYYKNGKLQYLFNTSEAMHLLDRNGNYVERYPVKFRSDATNGVVLFDYDKSRDYRIFVACEDRKVYAYDMEGNLVQGWSFRKSEGSVRKPVQHFRVGEKDYLVFSDQIRPYILDRRGKERVNIRETLVVSKQNGFYLDMNLSGNKPRLITSDTSGNVIGIDFDGNVEQILEYDAGPEHFFRTEDMNSDGVPEFIFADGNELEVVDIKGERLFSFKIKNDISTLPAVYEFSSSDLKIGITDAERNMIYLVNSDGSLYEGFPLEGGTPFSIGYFAGSDSRFNLIVGSENGFLYNYSIE